MRKKEDDWVYQYPSTTVNWKVVPTGANATPYIGDANKLLYQVKNNMTFNELGQLRAMRFIFGDTGILAKIIAGSEFGRDYIEIHVPSEAVPSIPSCSITLFNVPETIQPMHWYEDGIHDSEWLVLNPDGELEVEGVDYIKTYYFYNSENCSDCTLDLTVCDTNELQTTYGWTAPQTCKPFVFVDATIPVNEIYPNDHCIHGTCQAEIIDFGGDENGSYFRWKAYTEWSSLGPWYANFTQTGLGYLLLRGFTNYEGNDLCTSDKSVVKVDCCLKALADRTPVIYWEKCIGGGWCVAPTEGTIEEDLDYFWQYGGWISVVLWAKKNWCRPMTWTLVGIGEIGSRQDGMFADYEVPYADLGAVLDALGCNDSYQISINGTDRCGTDDSITFTHTPCCDTAATLEIGYTTLAMSCSGSQTLTVVGGCAPYGWSKIGGGTLTPADDTLTALYEAAATNAECANNATITLTDCCGGSDSIQIAVNCNTGAGEAYRQFRCTTGENQQGVAQCAYPTSSQLISGWAAFGDKYKCSGVLIDTYNYGARGNCTGYNIPCEASMASMAAGTYCEFFNVACKGGACSSPDVGCCNTSTYLNDITSTCLPAVASGNCWDQRTAAMKTAGCCPLNPFTGLPF